MADFKVAEGWRVLARQIMSCQVMIDHDPAWWVGLAVMVPMAIREEVAMRGITTKGYSDAEVKAAAERAALVVKGLADRAKKAP